MRRTRTCRVQRGDASGAPTRQRRDKGAAANALDVWHRSANSKGAWLYDRGEKASVSISGREVNEQMMRNYDLCHILFRKRWYVWRLIQGLTKKDSHLSKTLKRFQVGSNVAPNFGTRCILEMISSRGMISALVCPLRLANVSTCICVAGSTARSGRNHSTYARRLGIGDIRAGREKMTLSRATRIPIACDKSKIPRIKH